MSKKLKVGIVFGGQSKEREISFAGGRTVYDNLNKSIFEATPIFIDSFGNFIELNWEFVYKGTIRDFYPPVDFLPGGSPFQLYAENLGALSQEQQNALISKIGKRLSIVELKQKIDFAFLCLHGPYGEDGRIQGLFEYVQIPYSGSGILASAIGIDKSVQKELMVNKGFNSPKYLTIAKKDWIEGKIKNIVELVKSKVGFPCVIKPANQGSSIGVSILNNPNELELMSAIEKALFTKWMDAKAWETLTSEQKINFIKTLSDIREGIGMPIQITFPKELNSPVLYDPNKLIEYLDAHLKAELLPTKENGFVLESLDGESTVLIEEFIDGKEFSCIVLENEEGKAIALPPTEIRKGKELFDYRSKYLPGLSRKITPIDLPDTQIEAIRMECEKLFGELHFDVYARIDGFLSKSGKIFLNDPNTTSGMMPSSFFFHQAAEIGLNPSQFLTFIIRTSLAKRFLQSKGNTHFQNLLSQLDALIFSDKNALSNKINVAVILGGYSSERHISVESGRNVFEKLASSEKYFPIPVFLTGNAEDHQMYQLPINLLLKDNADDIKEKVENFKIHPVIENIRKQCESITQKYAAANLISAPEKITYQNLKDKAQQVFIALHGRPGEDGAVQEKLEVIGLPYNGSDRESSSLTIDKYKTNEILKANGFLVAEHALVSKVMWEKNKTEVETLLNNTIKYPFIAKPVDDGCSSAVKKIKTFAEFEAFCKLIFRSDDLLDAAASELLHIKAKEEFPQKNVILVEELISKKDATHFLEITGGMLTRFNEKHQIEYEVFEASEALADGDVLSLEEKFLAGQGQNITPARYSKNSFERQKISDEVKKQLGAAAKVLGVTGYCRIDAFVRIFENCKTEVIFIEVNSLPGMTPATCIFHQAAINQYKPYEFIDKILGFGNARLIGVK
ncbi:MAG: D-alanine--D-alanine ligase [Sphingobacteriaceae bacterium]|nr:D-alanine--D-alanine ligase [Sphingobacteriaceae bacterium]